MSWRYKLNRSVAALRREQRDWPLMRSLGRWDFQVSGWSDVPCTRGYGCCLVGGQNVVGSGMIRSSIGRNYGNPLSRSSLIMLWLDLLMLMPAFLAWSAAIRMVCRSISLRISCILSPRTLQFSSGSWGDNWINCWRLVDGDFATPSLSRSAHETNHPSVTK